jgi:quercetin dioxygenase-like cupin family protein
MQHTSWDAVREEALTDTITRRFITGDKVTAGQITLKKGCLVPTHQHEAEQICYVISGAVKFCLEGKEVVVSAGQTLVIPSNEPHSAEALEDSVALDVFSPIRHDWINQTDDYLRKK